MLPKTSIAYKGDCLVCLCGKFYKIMRYNQPVILLDCPHQNTDIQRVTMTISHTWSNLQMLMIFVYIFAIKECFDSISNASNDQEMMIALLDFGIVGSYCICLAFIFPKKNRLDEMESIQTVFEKHADMWLPPIFDEEQLRKINFINSCLVFSVLLVNGILVAYTAFVLYKTTLYFTVIFGFLLTCGSTNISFFYTYTYFIAYKVDTQITKLICEAIEDCRKDRNSFLRRLMDSKIAVKKTIDGFLGKRAVSLIIVFLCTTTGGIILAYVVIKRPLKMPTDEKVYLLFCYCFMFVSVYLLCELASCVYGSVSNNSQ